MEKKSKTVFVGLSGGVDSSVSAALLKAAGYAVVGVFIRTWQPDFIECSFREDRLDAMRVAAHLDIPFLECDAVEAYKHSVAEMMIEEYRSGRTPNPDVMCNREIKFGVFWNFAKAHGADYIATGHYAQIEGDGRNFLLKQAIDQSKDQSYFLYRLTSSDLAHTLFPIGGLLKTEVRALAKKFGLPTAQKKDSQGICMLGDLNLKQFLSHYIETKQGEVVNERGESIGYHGGSLFLTVGERHGFTITKKTPNDDRYYIIAKDVVRNMIVVSDKPRSVKAQNAKKTEFLIESVTWISAEPHEGKKYTAQVRYHGEQLPCVVSSIRKNAAVVSFSSHVLAASGQSIVIYENAFCLGGGIIH